MIERESASAVTAFAEHEHLELRRGVERIHEIACGADEHLPHDLASRLLWIMSWLDTSLEPHLAWEEAWLYAEVEARTGTPWATHAARFDHRRIREATLIARDDWAALVGDRPGRHFNEVRCHLFSLVALLRAHLDREDQLILPLLAERRAARAIAPVTSPS